MWVLIFQELKKKKKKWTYALASFGKKKIHNLEKKK